MVRSTAAQCYSAMIAGSRSAVNTSSLPSRARTPRADERGLTTYRGSPLYTDNAKPLKGPSILRAEHELRQPGAQRRDRDLVADCLERRSGN
eukprot:5959266-Pleurochrysis_carterae.AAC.1